MDVFALREFGNHKANKVKQRLQRDVYHGLHLRRCPLTTICILAFAILRFGLAESNSQCVRNFTVSGRCCECEDVRDGLDCVETCPGGTYEGRLQPYTNSEREQWCSQTISNVPLSQYECLECHSTCISCTGPTQEACIACKEGLSRLQMTPDSATCVEGCPSGYVADGQVCLPCQDSNCIRCDLNTCLVCDNGYQIRNSSCIMACPDREVFNGNVCAVEKQSKNTGKILATFLLPPLAILGCIFVTAFIIIGINKCSKRHLCCAQADNNEKMISETISRSQQSSVSEHFAASVCYSIDVNDEIYNHKKHPKVSTINDRGRGNKMPVKRVANTQSSLDKGTSQHYSNTAYIPRQGDNSVNESGSQSMTHGSLMKKVSFANSNGQLTDVDIHAAESSSQRENDSNISNNDNDTAGHRNNDNETTGHGKDDNDTTGHPYNDNDTSGLPNNNNDATGHLHTAVDVMNGVGTQDSTDDVDGLVLSLDNNIDSETDFRTQRKYDKLKYIGIDPCMINQTSGDEIDGMPIALIDSPIKPTLDDSDSEDDIFLRDGHSAPNLNDESVKDDLLKRLNQIQIDGFQPKEIAPDTNECGTDREPEDQSVKNDLLRQMRSFGKRPKMHHQYEDFGDNIRSSICMDPITEISETPFMSRNTSVDIPDD